MRVSTLPRARLARFISDVVAYRRRNPFAMGGLPSPTSFLGTSLTPQVGGDQFTQLMQLEPRHSPLMGIVLYRPVRPDLDRVQTILQEADLADAGLVLCMARTVPCGRWSKGHTSRGLTAPHHTWAEHGSSTGGFCAKVSVEQRLELPWRVLASLCVPTSAVIITVGADGLSFGKDESYFDPLLGARVERSS